MRGFGIRTKILDTVREIHLSLGLKINRGRLRKQDTRNFQYFTLASHAVCITKAGDHRELAWSAFSQTTHGMQGHYTIHAFSLVWISPL
jgi:hypothetical protein